MTLDFTKESERVSIKNDFSKDQSFSILFCSENHFIKSIASEDFNPKFSKNKSAVENIFKILILEDESIQQFALTQLFSFNH